MGGFAKQTIFILFLWYLGVFPDLAAGIKLE